MALVIPANADTKTITITPETMQTGSSSNKYVTTAFTFSADDFTFKTNQVNPSNGQLRISTTGNGAFTLSNTTAIPNIKSIAFTYTNNSTSTIGTWYAKTGNTEITALATSSDIAGNNGFFTIPESTSASFFRISLTAKGSGALYFSKIEITYDDTPAGPIEPGDVLVNGEANPEAIEVAQGETITFTSDKATKLEYESEELSLIDEIEGSTYTHTADFTNAPNGYILTVTPYDNKGTAYEAHAATIMITRKAAAACGEIIYTPADGLIAFGDAVKLSCENATEIKYTLNGGEELTYNDETGIVITKSTTIKAWGINGDGVKGAEKDFTIALLPCGEISFTPADGKVAEGDAIKIACENAATIKYTIDGGEEQIYNDQTGIIINAACTIVAWGLNGDDIEGDKATLNVTIKEADKYVLINRVADIKSGAKYILVGLNKTTNKAALMTTLAGNYCNDYPGVDFTDIITVGEGEYTGLNVFTINETATGIYSIQLANGNYLGCTNYNATSSGNFVNGSSNTGAGYKWEITFKEKEAIIECGYQQINYNSSANRFKTYYNYSSGSPVYLYRLIDDEYYTDEAPAELHIHGSHYAGSWAASSQFDQTATGVFTFYGFLAYEEGEATPALVFSTAAKKKADDPNTEVTGIRPRKAAPAADYWNDIEGDVFMPETDGAAIGTHKLVRVSTADVATGKASLNTFAAEHNKSYDLTVDFNGYSPVATLAEHDENNVPTGVENIDAAETAEVEYFNLSGIRVANPENGIFIRRQGNKVTKVLVK